MTVHTFIVSIETTDTRPDIHRRLADELDRALRYRFTYAIAIEQNDLPVVAPATTHPVP